MHSPDLERRVLEEFALARAREDRVVEIVSVTAQDWPDAILSVDKQRIGVELVEVTTTAFLRSASRSDWYERAIVERCRDRDAWLRGLHIVVQMAHWPRPASKAAYAAVDAVSTLLIANATIVRTLRNGNLLRLTAPGDHLALSVRREASSRTGATTTLSAGDSTNQWRETQLVDAIRSKTIYTSTTDPLWLLAWTTDGYHFHIDDCCNRASVWLANNDHPFDSVWVLVVSPEMSMPLLEHLH